MTTKLNLIKCKFCDWTRPKFITKKRKGKKARRISLYPALKNHCEMEHEESTAILEAQQLDDLSTVVFETLIEEEEYRRLGTHESFQPLNFT